MTAAPAFPPWLEAPLTALLAMRSSLPHALLLLGPRGIGKALLAERFAQSLLCESGAGGAACGRCDACGWFGAGNHPDFRRISPVVDEEGAAKSERTRRDIKIDQIRALGDFTGIGAHRGGRKLVLIDPAEAMNGPAANALLKTLEEPSGETIFLLVCGNPGGLPPTVRSRCVPFRVATPPGEAAASWLRAALPDDEVAIGQWLALADGAPLRALGLAEPAMAAAYRVVVQAGAEVADNSALKWAETCATLPASAWLPILQSWTSDLARASVGAMPIRFPAQAARLQGLARRTQLARVIELSRWLHQQSPIVEHPLNARLFAEDAWLRYERMFLSDRPAPA